MIKTNIILAYRSLMKEKGFTIINTIGLALGLSCFILMMVYVIHENSYDKFWKDSDRIYRLYLHGSLTSNNNDRNEGFLPYQLPDYLVKNYPEVEAAVPIDLSFGLLVKYNNITIQEWHPLIVDTNFFSLFPAEFVSGNPRTALIGSHKVIFTESVVPKWFGNENPVGKLVKIGSDSVLYEVTAVVKDPQTNTHVKYEMLITDSSFPTGDVTNWVNNRARFVYIKLKKNASREAFETKIQEVISKKIAPDIVTLTGKTILEFSGGSQLPQIRMESISDIHLNPQLATDIGGVRGNRSIVTVCTIIAIALLLLACINFINLSTARFTNRMKEVCIKKTFGSSKTALFTQFISESYILTFISILIALSMVELTIKPFCDVLQLEYLISPYQIPYFIPFVLGLFLVVGFLSGVYPALVMSSVNIIAGLKGKLSNNRGIGLRKALVILQFAVSFIILLGALVVSAQLDFIMHGDKGFVTDNTLVLHNIRELEPSKRLLLRDEALRLPGVQSATFSNLDNGIYMQERSVWKENDSMQNSVKFNMNTIDYNYIETMRVTLLKGRNFIKDNASDSLSVIINETAAHQLGYTNPIGKRLTIAVGRGTIHDMIFTIIGVVRDFNISPVHTKIQPLMMFYGKDDFSYMLLKFDPSMKQDIMKQLSFTWRQLSNGNDSFCEEMQDNINWIYRNEISANKMVTTFSIICILIACLGLIGLVSYATLRRTKEIGIRKANGAQVWQIIYALSKDTLVLIAIAIVIALPISIWAINRWLAQFAYHINISVGMVIIAVIGLYLIALLSEISLTLRAARQNPVKALRYE